MSAEFEREVLERFDAMDKRFDSMEKKFDEFRDDVKTEFFMVRTEMEANFKRVDEHIDKLDERVHNVEVICRDRFDVTDIRARLDMTEKVVGEHSEQIRELNRKVGIDMPVAAEG